MGTSDRRPYESATVLDQDLLDESQDNLTNKLEMICEIYDVGDPARTLYISDRAKYVSNGSGHTFYEPRAIFPVVERTIGDWLSEEVEFSSLTIQINNSDQKFNEILPGGNAYDGFIGKRLVLKEGLGEIGSTYTTLFSGEVTDVGGFTRDTASFTLICRNDFEKVNVTIPNQVLIEDDWPDIENEFIGLGAPVIYGDWTTFLRLEAPEVPAFPVNGLDPLVNASLDPVDPNVGDTPLRLVVSSTPIKTFDTTSVTLYRGDEYHTFSSSDITILGGSNNQVFDITQKNLLIDGSPWIYEVGDQFFLKVVGVDLSGYDSNIIAQAKDMLIRFGGLTLGDFDSSWDTIRDKATPVQSAINIIRSRVWIQEGKRCFSYVNSMLEQVRCESYVNRSNLFALSTLHFEDFNPNPSFTIKNWDIVRNTFRPKVDDRNNFNRAKADFSVDFGFSPTTGGNLYSTGLYRNDLAVTKTGRPISKLITFPNLINIDDVINQLTEILKLSSAYSEMIDMTLTTRSFLKDLSEDIILDVSIGSVDFTNVTEPVTAKIRKISYDPEGLVIPVTVWCFQMVPFPGSLKSGLSGITGGSSATITKET